MKCKRLNHNSCIVCKLSTSALKCNKNNFCPVVGYRFKLTPLELLPGEKDTQNIAVFVGICLLIISRSATGQDLEVSLQLAPV